MKNPTAAAVIIGNELLSGRTADANINIIARRMNDIGIRLAEVRIIADVEEDIVSTVTKLKKKYSYVITTGGIGPMHDDITVPCIAKVFGVEMVENQQVLVILNRNTVGKTKASTRKTAMYPKGAQILPAPDATTPGFYIGNVFVLAGISSIMQIMLEGAIPLMKQGEQFYSHSIDVILQENMLCEGLSQVQEQFSNVEIGSYPFRTGNQYGTSLVVRGTNQKVIDTAFHHLEKFLKEINAPVR